MLQQEHPRVAAAAQMGTMITTERCFKVESPTTRRPSPLKLCRVFPRWRAADPPGRRSSSAVRGWAAAGHHSTTHQAKGSQTIFLSTRRLK